MADLPSHIGPFEVRERLGTGGMGVVYLAYDPPLDRLVAIKVLNVDDDEIRQRFLREARFAARVQHPNIVAIYAVGEHNGRPYMAMEYIAGDTLASIIRGETPVPMGRRVQWLYELASGLEFAHRNGVVHRDVKPANLIVSRDSGLLRLLDFGIARDDDSEHTMAGHVIGTPSYMSPEQVTGGAVDARSDIFAFGLVAYELLSGSRAFQGATSYETTRLIVEADPEPLASRVSGLPAALAETVHRCLAKSPDRRPASLVPVRADLRRVLHKFDPVDEPSVVRTVVRPAAAATLTPTTSTGDKEKRKERRRQQIQSLVARARRALAAGQFEAAVEAAEQADLFDDRTPELSLLLHDVQLERQRRDVDSRLQQVREQIDRGDLSEAEAALSGIAPLAPPERLQPLREAVARVRLDQRVDRCMRDLWALLRSRDPEAAARRLQAESAEVRAHPRLEELTRTVEDARAQAREAAERRRRAAEEAEAKRRAEEAEARRLAEEREAQQRAEAEAEAKRLAEEAEAKRLAEEAEAKRRAEEAEARRLAEEREAQQRAEAEAEAKRLAEEAEAKRLAEEAEARRRAEEAEAKRLAEAEAKRLAEEAEAKRLAEEAEARRLAEEREAQQRAEAEAEAKRLAEEAEARRLAEQREAQQRAGAEAKRLAEEAEAQRLAEEAEAQRRAEDAEAKRRAEEAEAQRLVEEREAQQRAEAEAEARRLAEKAEADAAAQRKADAARAKRQRAKDERRQKREAKAAASDAETSGPFPAPLADLPTTPVEPPPVAVPTPPPPPPAAPAAPAPPSPPREATALHTDAVTMVVPILKEAPPAEPPSSPHLPTPTPPSAPVPALDEPSGALRTQRLPAAVPASSPAWQPPPAAGTDSAVRAPLPPLPMPLIVATVVGALVVLLVTLLWLTRDTASPTADVSVAATDEGPADAAEPPGVPARPTDPEDATASDSTDATTEAGPGDETPATDPPGNGEATATAIVPDLRRLIAAGRLNDALGRWQGAADAPDRAAGFTLLMERYAEGTSRAKAAASARGATQSDAFREGQAAEGRAARLARSGSIDAADQFRQATSAFGRAEPPAVVAENRPASPPRGDETPPARPATPPPASEPRDAPPKTAPTPPAAADPRAAVLAVLDAFAAAYNRRDLDGLAALWPSMPSEWRSSLTTSFRTFSDVHWTYTGRTLTMKGDAAQAAVSVAVRSTGSRGTVNSNRRYAIDLRRQGAAWVITGITLQQ